MPDFARKTTSNVLASDDERNEVKTSCCAGLEVGRDAEIAEHSTERPEYHTYVLWVTGGSPFDCDTTVDPSQLIRLVDTTRLISPSFV